MSKPKILNLLKPLTYQLVDWHPSELKPLLPQWIEFLTETDTDEGILIIDSTGIQAGIGQDFPESPLFIPSGRYRFQQNAPFDILKIKRQNVWTLFRIFSENGKWIQQVWTK